MSLKKVELFVFLCSFVIVLCGKAAGIKECTNIPSQLQSHTAQHELFSSNNETWKAQMFSHYNHLTATDDSAWPNSSPRKGLRQPKDEFDWAMMYKKLENSRGVGSDNDFLKEVSLHDVRLQPSSAHWTAQQTNLEYLLLLDVDSLVWSFRKTAGLPTPGKPYGGWEAPDQELRGHFVGHYLSASALMWASTQNDTLKEKMSAIVSALATCQEKMGSGYLSAFPTEFFDRAEAIKLVWAPYYTIHKIMAGLLDQYTFAANEQALKMVTWMAEYFYNRVQNVITKYSIARHYTSLNIETGGMNDVLYKLFKVTNDTKHFVLAHLFDKPCFLGMLAVQADDLSGLHANTHIPIVIGTQMRYEITRDPLYKAMGTFFLDIVNSSHTYATGGTSVNEHWTDPKRLATTLEKENEESCTTYNMLKVSRHLFRWTKEITYADYYERAFTNGVLSIQRGTEPGVMIYMLPLGRGVSKAKSKERWGTQFNTFWCCYGTGIESFSKLGDSIYFEEQGRVPSLYIIQYISSSLDWKSGKFMLNQKVDPVVSWDPRLRVTLTFSPKGASKSSKLNLRIPSWSNLNGAKAVLNRRNLAIQAPGTFLSIVHKWRPKDILSIELPIGLRTEAIQDDRPEYASTQAILYGPILLAGLTDGDWDINAKSASSPSDWITPIPASSNSQLVSLCQGSGDSNYVLSNSNQSFTLEKFPQSGTDAAIHATFRVITLDPSPSQISSLNGFIGKSVMLELFHVPGMVLAQNGIDKPLGVIMANGDRSSVFHLVNGLDGKNGSVSLESESQKGCYVYSPSYSPGTSLTLSCRSGSSDSKFNQATSFTMANGISNYHPVSFVAKGSKRNFVLMPLYALRDETYTVYFNIQS